MLKVQPLKTEIYRLGDDFNRFLSKNLKGALLEGRILAVTSKIVSLAEGRLIAKSAVKSKKELIQKEADRFLGETGFGCYLTIKESLLIPSAGVDSSNAEGEFYIMYPEKPFLSAENIYKTIKRKFHLKNFGVLLTDSRTLPLRRGVVGAALAYFGFRGVQSKIGEKDLFGRELKITQINLADALAAAAVLSMGEGAESRPLALLSAPAVFEEKSDFNKELHIPFEDDLYKPLLENFFSPPPASLEEKPV